MLRILLMIMLIVLSGNVHAVTEISTAGTNIAIGTTSIANALSVQSTLAVGSATYTSKGAVSNGAIIEGNVGIGSFAPTAALDVVGVVNTNQYFQSTGNGDSYFGTGNVGIGTFATCNATTCIKNVGATTGLSIGSTYAITNYTGVGDGAIIQGNVGIGTFIPTQKLDVLGTARVSGFQLTTTPTSGYVLTTNSTGIGTWAPVTGGGSTSPSGGSTAVQYNNSGAFGGDETKFSFNGTNVGIGTTTSVSSLAVNGGVTIGTANNSGISAPSNNLLVMGGNIGIATLTTSAALTVGITTTNRFTVDTSGLATFTDGTGSSNSIAIVKSSATSGHSISITQGGTTSTGSALLVQNSGSSSAAESIQVNHSGASSTGPALRITHSGGTGPVAIFEDATNDTNPIVFTSAGNMGIGTTTAGAIVSIPSLKASTGTRFLCIDTNGFISSATTCTGT